MLLFSKKTIFLIIITFLSILSYADGVEFVAKAPSLVGVGQSFQVQYTSNKKGSNISLGDYSGFKLLGGPSISTSQSIQIINGNMSQTNTYTYTYTFQALNAGIFNIGPASIIIDGKTYTSNSVTIEVQKEPVQTQNNNRRRNTYDPFSDFYDDFFQPRQAPEPLEITDEDIFARIIVDKTNVYKGEPIIATIKIFTTVDLIGFNDIKLPAFDAFYTEEIESPERIYFNREIVNNKTYNTAIIKKYILYPRFAGKTKIEKAEFDCNIRISSGGFWGYSQTQNKKISTSEIPINVNSLPNAPSSFTGAIGKFNFKIEKSTDTALVNDAVTFKFIISGTGNFSMIETPKLTWPKEFDVYDPVVNANISATSAGMNGSKVWEYTIIPRFPGIFNLGRFKFTYFDTGTKQYKTIESEDIKIAIKKDINDTNFDSKNYVYSQKDIEYIGNEDIRYIVTKDLHLKSKNFLLLNKSIFPFLYIIPLIIFIVIIIVMRKTIKERANVIKLKQKNAGKVSRKKLKKARTHLNKGENEKFYKEIISALWGFASDKMCIPTAELTKDRIVSEMEKFNIDSEIINEFVNIIDTCEYAHFAPGSNDNNNQQIYDRAADIIEKLNIIIK